MNELMIKNILHMEHTNTPMYENNLEKYYI